LAAWLRVGLGVALSVGITQWPYGTGCGSALFLYLGAIGVVGFSGLWAMIGTWRRRVGLGHGISILVLLWALALATLEVLPRIGYAKEAATWLCE
jgi:hypothetical protein